MKRREALQYCTALMGYGFAASIAGFSLTSCGADDSERYLPKFLTPSEYDFLQAFADTLLPTSDTPGASDVGVAEALDSIANGCFSQEQKDEMKAGFLELTKKCQELNGAPLTECDGEQRTALFNDLEREEISSSRYLWGNVIFEGSPQPFYRKLKGMCLWLYFTSETVGEQVLNYDPIPGDFKGCVPLKEIGRSWSI